MGIAPILAYIDPVSGTVLLQLIIAGIIGSMAYFRKSLQLLIFKVTGRGRPLEPRRGSEP